MSTLTDGTSTINTTTLDSTAEITCTIDAQALDAILGCPKKATNNDLAKAGMQYIASIMPKPKRIDQYDKATIVHWDDGTYTAVTCGEMDKDNIYAAYCAALAKKIYGSTSAVHKLVDKHEGKTVDRMAEIRRKAQLELNAEAAERNRKRKVAEYKKELGNIKDALLEMLSSDK